jgi:hypothetical protein
VINICGPVDGSREKIKIKFLNKVPWFPDSTCDPTLPMVLTPATIAKKVTRIRPKLSAAQKQLRQEKFANLTNDIQAARSAYQQEAEVLSKKYGRSVSSKL